MCYSGKNGFTKFRWNYKYLFTASGLFIPTYTVKYKATFNITHKSAHICASVRVYAYIHTNVYKSRLPHLGNDVSYPVVCYVVCPGYTIRFLWPLSRRCPRSRYGLSSAAVKYFTVRGFDVKAYYLRI